MKTVKENNQMIAVFMGWKLGHPELLELRWSEEWFDGIDRKTTKGFLHFHTDWNWLMPVFERIENFIEEQEYDFESPEREQIDDIITLDFLCSAFLQNNIDWAYNVACEAIEWCNENRKI